MPESLHAIPWLDVRGGAGAPDVTIRVPHDDSRVRRAYAGGFDAALAEVIAEFNRHADVAKYRRLRAELETAEEALSVALQTADAESERLIAEREQLLRDAPSGLAEKLRKNSEKRTMSEAKLERLREDAAAVRPALVFAYAPAATAVKAIVESVHRRHLEASEGRKRAALSKLQAVVGPALEEYLIADGGHESLWSPTATERLATSAAAAVLGARPETHR